MATLKNDKEKDKSAVTETTETTNNTEINVNAETSNTEAVTHNQVTTEIKAEKKEDKLIKLISTLVKNLQKMVLS